MKIFPIPEQLDYSINVSIIIHCTAIGLSVLAALALWFCLTVYGNAFHRLALRLTRLSTSGSNIMLSIMTHLPVTYGILTIGVALGACSGLALFLAFVFYFLMVSNAYKDYLEDYLWQKAANFVHMAAGIGEDSNTNKEDQSTTVANTMDQSLVSSDDDEQSQNQEHDGKQEQKSLQPDKDQAKKELCVGLQNFSFHITLLLMLLTLLLLSVPASLAWLRSRRCVSNSQFVIVSRYTYESSIYRHGIVLPDPSLHTSIVALGSLSLLLQLRAPQKL